MADTLYDIAEHLKRQILSSSDREKTAADFFSNHGHVLKREDVIVLDDGTPIIRDDPGRDYDRQQLQQLKEDISGQLSLFREEDLPLQDESRGRARKGEEGSGGDARKVRNVSRRYNPILRDGVSAYYSPEKGWNGKEQHPWTVKGAWDSFGFVDFLGMNVRNVHDIAQMFSIYRNPMLEYFHIILAKNGRIVRQIAMTSGLSGLVRVIPSGGKEKLQEIIGNVDYDAAYLVHNHPSGNISPSDEDLSCTAFYVSEIFKNKFIGHIILDHTRFSLISAMTPNVKSQFDLNVSDFMYAPHEIPKRKSIFGRISSPSDIARIIFDIHNQGNIILDLDNDHMVSDIRPFSISDYDPALFMLDMKAKCVRDRVIVVSSEESFDKLQDKFNEFPYNPVKGYKQPVLDCLYVDVEKGIYKSMLEYGLLDRFNWQSFLAKQNTDHGFIWNEDISEHPKQGYLFEKKSPYITSGKVFSPSEKELENYNKQLSSHKEGTSIPVRSSSPILQALGYPKGSVTLSDTAIEDAEGSKVKKEIIENIPNIVSDPASIIDTGVKTGEKSKDCLLFAYNTIVDGEYATVGLLIEPVERKLKTDYVVQAVFSPEEISRGRNRLFSECARNNQFIYSETDKPFFIIPGNGRDSETVNITKITLPEKVPDRTAVLERCIQKEKRIKR